MFQDAETVADVPKKIVCFVEMENKYYEFYRSSGSQTGGKGAKRQ